MRAGVRSLPPRIFLFLWISILITEWCYSVDNPSVEIQGLSDLARGYTRIGEYSKAEPIYKQIVEIREKHSGSNHPLTATAIYNLAWFYANLADYAKAEALFQQALDIRRNFFGPEHPSTAECLNSLAVLQENIGNYIHAEALYQQALQIQQKTLGARHAAIATTLNNLGSLYWILGDYSKSEVCYNQALEIRRQTLGPEHPYTATTLNNLALLDRSMGDLDQAESLFEEALRIRQKVLGHEHPFTITSIHNLGVLYADQEDDARAEPLLTQAAQSREKTLGPDHPDTTRSLNELALLYDRRHKYHEAEELFLKALEGRRKTLGSRHSETAISLHCLASHYHLMGDLEKARPFYLDALQIREQTLGAYHLETLKTLENLAYLEFESGRSDLAEEYSHRMTRGQEKRLNDIFSFTSEQQRLEFRKTLNLYSLPSSLRNASDIAQTVLRTKGLVLDSFLEDQLVVRASEDPEVKSILDQLQIVSRQLMELEFEPSQHPDLSPSRSGINESSSQTERERLKKEKKKLESAFLKKVATVEKTRRALGITIQEVQAAIPKDSALVELFHYPHYLGKLQFQNRYGSVILTRQGTPKWVPLGKAEDIEKRIKLYQNDVRKYVNPAIVARLLQGIYREVWKPIEDQIAPGAKSVIISPDGELNFLSFATLLTPENRFLAEQHNILYVTSGRDLLRQRSQPLTSKDLLVFANPDFNGKPVSAAENTLLRSPTMPQRLVPLPGTRREADFLKAQSKTWGLTCNCFLGAQASEATLSSLKSPRILHLATHGFFLSKDRTRDEKGESFFSAMRRSVLALSGAQITLDAWGKGDPPPSNNDGILTAQEVGMLDLHDTWMVVLSACDTGTGEASAGEGVLGLRRGFIQAGTKNLLMTLWPVADTETVQIIQDFYNRALQNGDAPGALAEVQRYWLKKLRDQHGLSTAVRLAGPFILSYQGGAL